MTSVAIVYDKFLVQGGGERVCEMLLEALPEADLYALNASPRKFWEEKLGRRIVSPRFGGLFNSRFLVTAFYPLAALLMSSLRIKADVVFAYSSTCGKFVRLDCNRSILYSNFPNRGLYQTEKVVRNAFIRACISPVIGLMSIFERRQIAKYDRTISISEASRRAMHDFAGVDSDVLMPPFDERGLQNVKFLSEATDKRYFVLVSRLEPEKEIEYVIQAFKGTPHDLKVIGSGALLGPFRRLQIPNIEFLGYVDDQALGEYLAGAKALIFPSDIEYSLVPLEATFLGTPVISFDGPAMREILIDAETGRDGANSIFFDEKSPGALMNAIARFDAIHWDIMAVKHSAIPFSREAFIARIRALVETGKGEMSTFNGD